MARERNVDFLLVQPEKYEGPSGLTYRSCGFKKAFDIYRLETHISHPRIPSGVQLASIPQVQEPPLRTHVMMCGWDNISKKTWDFGVNPNVEMLSAFSQHMLALCALKNKTKYFFHVYQNLFQRTKGSLHLWSPIPLNQKELQDVFQAAKTVASWLGIKTLTMKTIERYVAVSEKLGFSVRSKAEPYLVKRLR